MARKALWKRCNPLAALARFGLVRGSFIPPKDLRELRQVSRYRRKLGGICSSQI